MRILTIVTLFVFVLALSKAVPMEKEEEEDESVEDEEEQEENEDQDENEEQEQEETPKKKKIVKPHPPFPPPSLTSYYHNKTRKYYEALSQGPCPTNLKFLKVTSKPNEKYGECGCHQHSPMGSESYVPQVFHEATQRCYFIYRQSYCKNESYWLVYTAPDRVECVKNPCIHSDLDVDKVVLLNGRCIELGDDCPSEQGNYIVAFRQFDVVPSCAESLIGPINFVAGEILGCPTGMRPLPNGRCVPYNPRVSPPKKQKKRH